MVRNCRFLVGEWQFLANQMRLTGNERCIGLLFGILLLILRITKENNLLTDE